MSSALSKYSLLFAIISLFYLTTIFGPRIADAEIIEVITTDFSETKQLNLPPGQKADIIVHLKSAGDVVDDFRLVLVDVVKSRPIRVRRTNEHGIVTFYVIPAGRYSVHLRPTSEQAKASPTVMIGDIQLNISAGKREELIKDEPLTIDDKQDEVSGKEDSADEE